VYPLSRHWLNHEDPSGQGNFFVELSQLKREQHDQRQNKIHWPDKNRRASGAAGKGAAWKPCQAQSANPWPHQKRWCLSACKRRQHFLKQGFRILRGSYQLCRLCPINGSANRPPKMAW